jgi:hypothetical protein
MNHQSAIDSYVRPRSTGVHHSVDVAALKANLRARAENIVLGARVAAVEAELFGGRLRAQEDARREGRPLPLWPTEDERSAALRSAGLPEYHRAGGYREYLGRVGTPDVEFEAYLREVSLGAT